MSDQAKFQKMLEVLLLLDCQYGRTISELSERFEISQRTVYRYLDTFKHVGFVIENSNGYFKIDKENTTVQEISSLLHFSEEEAFILSKAIHSIDDNDELKIKLVKKLYSLYDFDRVIHAIAKKEESENIYSLLQAIKQQKQVVLQSYKSGNSKNIRDRIVEPIDFTINYTGVWCYDVEDGINKVFKTSRIKQVILLESSWKSKPKHKKGIIDIFRVQSFEPIVVSLELSLVAYNLIIEEYPLSEKYITKITDNLYRLECEVGNFLGVGRFILGLLGEVKIIEPEALKDYVQERLNTYKA
ncbi:helix-turn-helix transcriptional regulator [Flavobacterium gawalongense]|uniref:WYL domain-containing protein n=1 Tax=Flavobacterium gawalongense TaxID=2594432 RepID=A0ABY3CQ17_9FLAO|nr:WYL domain-containing protein [Flavobacterium gawalongense]TRX03214.1 WYL domain-containing protein [Flavobacterium gawalongense]TRX09876.1 WYL domain-containing protein [Flavobacterium gawalongense]